MEEKQNLTPENRKKDSSQGDMERTKENTDIENTDIESADTESIDVIEEMQKLNRLSKESKFQTYSKSTYWNQQDMGKGGGEQVKLLEKNNEILLRIEARLGQIEALLEDKG